MLGDNRVNLDDLRYWKNLYVDVLNIEGKVRIKYYLIKDFEILK